MATASDTLIKLNALIQEGINILSTLNQLLEREHQALTDRDLNAISEINQEKHTTLELFDKNNQARAACLSEANVPNSKEGIKSILAKLNDAHQTQLFAKQWHLLENTLKEVMDANKRNELILMRQRQSLEQFIGALQGQKPANKLYTAKGATGNYTGQSRLGKA